MNTIWEQRASTILFNLIKCLETPGVFLLPANICPIVPVTFIKAGRAFELIDISPRTFCLDEQVLLQKFEDAPDHYSGILFAHTYGMSDSFESLFKSIKHLSPRSLVIDDRCLCIQDFDDEEETSADVRLYSTGYSKYVDMGFGGYAFIKPEVRYNPTRLSYNAEDHQVLVASMREAQENKRPFTYHDCDWLDCGTPSVLFDAYKSEVIARLPMVHAHKKLLNDIYNKNIQIEVQMGRNYHDWRFNILVPQKEKLLKLIFDQGLFASSHYPSLIDVFGQGQGYHTNILHSRVVNLFNNDRFTAEQAEQASKIVYNHINLYGCR